MIWLAGAWAIVATAGLAVGARFAWRWYRHRFRGKHAAHDAFRWQR